MYTYIIKCCKCTNKKKQTPKQKQGPKLKTQTKRRKVKNVGNNNKN